MIPWCDINITYQFLPSRVFGLVPACKLKPPQKLGGVSAWFSLKQLINAEEKWTSKSQKSKNLFGRVKSEESQNWPKSVLKKKFPRF